MRILIVSLVALGWITSSWADPCPPMQPTEAPSAAKAEDDSYLSQRPKTIMHFDENEKLEKVEVDTNEDGKLDRWEYYEGKEKPAEIAMDRDHDGQADLNIAFDEKGNITSAIQNGVDVDAAELEKADPSVKAALRIERPRRPEPCDGKECHAYMEGIQSRVYEHWEVKDAGAKPGSVSVSFLIDSEGCPRDVSVHGKPDEKLAQSCLEAIEKARPFPKPGPELSYVSETRIKATFALGDQ